VKGCAPLARIHLKPSEHGIPPGFNHRALRQLRKCGECPKGQALTGEVELQASRIQPKTERARRPLIVQQLRDGMLACCGDLTVKGLPGCAQALWIGGGQRGNHAPES
jgi:hypothetical protein